MPWIYFDDADRQSPAPAFNLERLPDGGRLALGDFYEQSALVLIFLPDSAKPFELSLAPFSRRFSDYHAQNAQLLAILPGKISVPEAPFPVLADPDGQTRAAYAALLAAELLPEEYSALFVLDVYGAPWAAYTAPRLDDPNLPDELLSWVSYIGIQCPE